MPNGVYYYTYVCLTFTAVGVELGRSCFARSHCHRSKVALRWLCVCRCSMAATSTPVCLVCRTAACVGDGSRGGAGHPSTTVSVAVSSSAALALLSPTTAAARQPPPLSPSTSVCVGGHCDRCQCRCRGCRCRGCRCRARPLLLCSLPLLPLFVGSSLALRLSLLDGRHLHIRLPCLSHRRLCRCRCQCWCQTSIDVSVGVGVQLGRSCFARSHHRRSTAATSVSLHLCPRWMALRPLSVSMSRLSVSRLLVSSSAARPPLLPPLDGCRLHSCRHPRQCRCQCWCRAWLLMLHMIGHLRRHHSAASAAAATTSICLV